MLNAEHTRPFIQDHEIEGIRPQVEAAAKLLESKKGLGNDYLGWLDLPINYDRSEFKRIETAAKRIRKEVDVLLVIGIGGSYLGAKAAIEFCQHSFFNHLTKTQRKAPQIFFAGTNISATYMAHLDEIIGSRKFAINIISKSGTTTEPALAFRFFRKKLEEQVGKERAKDLIFATTDREKGALKTLADQEGYETFVVPDDVGGRFSVLTAVGLLPIAAANIDIKALMRGAADARKEYKKPFSENDCYKYVALRNILLRKGKMIEMMINYEPRCQYIAEWWKQLFGESEGKDQKGIFPASANFTTDLHSLGQYVQDGRRHLFETLLHIVKPETDMTIESDAQNLDKLNYLSGKGFNFVNEMAAKGTLEAHVSGGVPNIILEIPEATPYHLGRLFYFFEKACGISGYLLGVNPFDQPGVEDYKRNMFRLLEKK